MQNVNPSWRKENQLADLDTAIELLKTARHRTADVLMGRVPPLRAEAVQVTATMNIDTAMGLLNKFSTAGQSPS